MTVRIAYLSEAEEYRVSDSPGTEVTLMRSIFSALLTAGLLTTTAIVLVEGGSRPAVAQTAEAQMAEADRLINQGIQQVMTSRYREALQSWQQALEIYQQATVRAAFPQQSRNGEAKALNNLGAAYGALSQYRQAIEYHQQALPIHQAVEDRIGEANALVNLGIAYQLLSQYQQAIEYYQQALPIFQAVENRNGEAAALNNQGVAYLSLSQYQQAIEYYQQALPIYRAVEDRNGEANALMNLGLAYKSLNQYQQAIEYYQQALPIYRAVEDRNGEALALNNLGVAYQSLSQYQQAIEYYQQALPIFRAVENRNGEANALMNLGVVYKSLSQYQQAIEYFQQALPIFQAVEDRNGEANALGNLGIAYRSLSQYQQAIEYYQQALPIFQAVEDRNGEANALMGLGNAYWSLSQYQQASEYYQQALPIFRAVEDREGQGKALANIGRLLERQNQPELAIVFLKQSVNVRESIRGDIRGLSQELQQSYTDSVAGGYRKLADLLLTQGRILEAEKVLNLLKVEEIREYSRGAVANPQTRQTLPPTPAEQAILDEHESIVAFAGKIADCERNPDCPLTELSKLNDQRQALLQEFEDAVKQFSAEAQARRSRGGDDQVLGLETDRLTSLGADIVKAQPNTVLVYPVVLEEKLWVLWFSAAGVANAIEVPVTEQEITDAVFEFRRLMRACEVGGCDSGSAIQDIQAVSQKLYNWVIPPQLEQELEQNQESEVNQIKNIIFAPDWTLRYISMSALFDGEQYLIEKYAVSTITATSIANRDQPLSNDASVLALGLSEAVPENPAEGIPKFEALDHVETELSAIVRAPNSRASGGTHRGVEKLNQLFDQNAFLEATRHQILHIATHGYFDPSSFDASYLILGTKTPWRISALVDPQARLSFRDVSLVVLSACETALGLSADPDRQTADGREVSSIAQAFIDAGANTVIASLWQVNDGSTSALMQQFYSHLSHSTAAQPVPIPQAMRAAQLSLITGEQSGDLASRGGVRLVPVSLEGEQPQTTRYAHPYYWSGFTIISNGQ